MSEAITNGIRVEVLCRYAPENSRPLHREWVFQYTVRITNHSDETVQLISRHWTITDGLEHVEEVRGPGVVGEQPVLAPGESYKYSSWCPLPTPTGVMRGTYQMVRIAGPAATSSTSRSRPSRCGPNRPFTSRPVACRAFEKLKTCRNARTSIKLKTSNRTPADARSA